MSDKMRKSFEEWALSEGYPITRGHYFDVYASAETRAAYLAWQAAHAAALPPGFVAVPVEPTHEMLETMREKHWEIRGCQLCAQDYRDIHTAMLAAAPKKDGSYENQHER